MKALERCREAATAQSPSTQPGRTQGAAEQLTLLLDGNDNFHVFWQESYTTRHPRQTAHPGNREGAPWLVAKAGKSSAARRNSGLQRQQEEAEEW